MQYTTPNIPLWSKYQGLQLILVCTQSPPTVCPLVHLNGSSLRRETSVTATHTSTDNGGVLTSNTRLAASDCLLHSPSKGARKEEQRDWKT